MNCSSFCLKCNRFFTAYRKIVLHLYYCHHTKILHNKGAFFFISNISQKGLFVYGKVQFII